MLLREIMSDVQKYGVIIKLREKENKSYKEREKYIKDWLSMEHTINKKYKDAYQFFIRILEKYYEDPALLMKNSDKDIKNIFKICLH